jgi:Holliday junction resolvase RusA-like endonuclease
MATHKVTKDGKLNVGQTHEWRHFKKHAPKYLECVPKFQGYVNIYVYWCPEDDRLSDLDNRVKNFLDVLVDAKIIEDDVKVVTLRAVKLKSDSMKFGLFFMVEQADPPRKVDELLEHIHPVSAWW